MNSSYGTLSLSNLVQILDVVYPNKQLTHGKLKL